MSYQCQDTNYSTDNETFVSSGLMSDALKICPSNLELLNLAMQFDVHKLEEFAMHLGLEYHTLVNIDYQYRYNPVDAMFSKLRKWKETKAEKATFEELLTALDQVGLNRHYLCKVRRNNYQRS